MSKRKRESTSQTQNASASSADRSSASAKRVKAVAAEQEEQYASDDDKPISQIKAKYQACDVEEKCRQKPHAGEHQSQEQEDCDPDDLPIAIRFGARRSGPKSYWKTLEHNGLMFPPLYEPHGVKMLYDGKKVKLTPEQEEIATMFAVMKDTDYVGKEQFRKNFWEEWQRVLGPGHKIKSLELCDFTPIYEWDRQQKEQRKLLPLEEKKRLREEKAKLEEKFMWATVDGVQQKVGNFKMEPPGLFRGRGNHPKMGKLKRRVWPEDVTLNIGKNAPIPECSMPGHRWKGFLHNNRVTWLAVWFDHISGRDRYLFLHQSSNMKADSDKLKYERARMLKDHINGIREAYTKNFKSSDPTMRQFAVVIYLIDKLALRAGNEKDDEEADTVGCCSLKVENVSLTSPDVVEFDFLGKDSIRYLNTVNVEEDVFAALQDFQEGKKGSDDLFEKIDTWKINLHLKAFMPGLSAKVFRTYNASYTLDAELSQTGGVDVREKIAAYQTANKKVAILCNHQRAVSKSHSVVMEKLETKMNELKALRKELVEDLKRAKKGKPPRKDSDQQETEGKKKIKRGGPEQLQKKIAQMDAKLAKLQLDMQVRDDMKTISLDTSKINYMDPRITVAWCKRNEVPIEKVFSRTLLSKFAWAMDVEPNFQF